MITESKKSELVEVLVSGDLIRARALVSSLSHKEQSTAFVRNFLGTILLHEGKIEGAIEQFHEAVQIENNYTAPMKNLAIAYLQLNKFDLASSSICKALAVAPEDEGALHTAGVIRLRSGDLNDAILNLKKCVEKAPKNPKFLNSLGLAYFNATDFLFAIRYFKEASILAPNFLEATVNLAKSYRELGRYDESNLAFDWVLEKSPKNEFALLGKSVNLLNSGRSADAVSLLNELVEMQPNSGDAYSLLSSIQKTKTHDPLFLQMEKAVNGFEKISKESLMHFRHAMFKSYERSGNFADAFQNLNLANELQIESRVSDGRSLYNIDQDRSLFRAIEELEESNPLAEGLSCTTLNSIPIFILGLPRSGTSLVERIIGNHTRVQMLGELRYLGNAIEQAGILKPDLKSTAFAEVRALYLSKARQHNLEAAYFTDKMPSNFRWISVISRSFPEAKIVHVYRNPQANCFSIYAQIFRGNFGFDNKMKDIASYHDLYTNLIEKLSANHNYAIHHLDYEKLVENPNVVTKKLFEFLDLDWSTDLLAMDKSRGVTATASRLQVGKPIYTGSSTFWKHYEEYIDQSILHLEPFEPERLKNV